MSETYLSNTGHTLKSEGLTDDQRYGYELAESCNDSIGEWEALRGKKLIELDTKICGYDDMIELVNDGADLQDAIDSIIHNYDTSISEIKDEYEI